MAAAGIARKELQPIHKTTAYHSSGREDNLRLTAVVCCCVLNEDLYIKDCQAQI